VRPGDTVPFTTTLPITRTHPQMFPALSGGSSPDPGRTGRPASRVISPAPPTAAAGRRRGLPAGRVPTDGGDFVTRPAGRSPAAGPARRRRTHRRPRRFGPWASVRTAAGLGRTDLPAVRRGGGSGQPRFRWQREPVPHIDRGPSPDARDGVRRATTCLTRTGTGSTSQRRSAGPPPELAAHSPGARLGPGLVPFSGRAGGMAGWG
jgi:hypothetical protein